MMWTTPPLPCTLAGIVIMVESIENTYNQALIEHVYPDRDGADLEPVGADANRLSVTGYVTGPTWLWDLEVLVAAIQEPGAHVFVHPQLGTLTGRVRMLAVTHRDEEHDLARIRLDFVEGRLVDTLSFAAGSSIAASAAAVRTAAAAVTAAYAALVA
jgi:prophage DNA circulation protein